MGKITVDSYDTNDGKRYRYRFTTASIGGKTQTKTKRGFKTKKAAYAAGEKAQQLYLNTGKSIVESDMSYADFLDYWMEHDVRRRCKPTTVHNYEKNIKNRIKPVLGAYYLKKISRQNIKDFLADLYDEGFSPNTISVVRGILTSSFTYAVDSEFIMFSPAANIRPPKKGSIPPKKPTRLAPHIYITPEQMKTIFERFPEGHPSHLPLMLGYHCGLRIGEVFGLVWEDIDFKAKTLSINRQIQWMADTERTPDEKLIVNGTNQAGSGYWYLAEPKYRSYRTISLDSTLLELLQKEKAKADKAASYYKKYYATYNTQYPIVLGGEPPTAIPPFSPIERTPSKWTIPIHLVNVRENGTFISPRTLQHTSSVIRNKLGIIGFDFHSLRHTHGTYLRDNGVPEIYISRRLGHKNIDVTLNVYTNHLTDTVKSQGDTALNAIF